ncbi:hypothetical protein KHQ89_01540 [Mycoplasmatota bacterium]|nr:hypothetical protein KHQ89_01540 [Mycoplasmatota bacterium]
MKFLFKHLILPILIILAIPAAILAFMYSDVSLPVDDYEASSSVDLTSMISDEMNLFLTNPTTDSALSIGVAQADANTMIKDQLLLNLNENFLEGSGGDNDEYVIKEDFFGYQGSWVRFKDDIVEIESGAHIFVGGFTYKTSLLITFKLEVDTEEVTLTLDKINIGHMPFAWIFGVADWAVETATGNDIEGMINDQLNGLATFDPGTREIKFAVQELIDQQIGQDDPQSASMINALLTFLGQNELLDIGFNDSSFDVDLQLGKLLDQSTPVSIDAADQIADEADFQSILEAKATSIAISVLTTNTDPFIDLDEFTLNRMMDYMMRNTASSPGVLFETTFLDQYILTAGMLYVEMDDNFVVNIPLEIVDNTDANKSFQTIIKIDATPSIENESDFVIQLNSLIAGEVTLDGENMDAILALIGDNDFIQDGNIVIEDFDQQMQQAGMSINDVEVSGTNLRLYVGLNEAIDLAGLQDEIGTILEDNIAVDYPTVGDEIDALLDILDGTSTDDPEEAAQALIEAIGELDDADQQALFDDLAEDLEDTPYSFDDILGIMP